MFVHTDDHIRAHLLICFTSLLTLRLLELKMGKNSVSAERIQRALSGLGCTKIAKGVMFLDMITPNKAYIPKVDENGYPYFSLQLSDSDETVDDLLKIQKAFGSEFQYVNVKQEALSKYLKSIKFAITK